MSTAERHSRACKECSGDGFFYYLNEYGDTDQDNCPCLNRFYNNPCASCAVATKWEYCPPEERRGEWEK